MDTTGGGPDFVIIDGEDFVDVPRAAIAVPSDADSYEPRAHDANGLFYSCMMERPVFVALARGWFANWRRETVTSYVRTPPQDGTAEYHWHSMGAPLLEELIDASPELASALLQPNGHALCNLCGAPERKQVRYLMLSLDVLIVTPKVVRMDGVAVRLG